MLVKCLFILPQKRVRESPHSQRHFYQQQQHSMSAVAYKNLHDPHQAQLILAFITHARIFH